MKMRIEAERCPAFQELFAHTAFAVSTLLLLGVRVNASMILTGMGPVDVLRSNAAKVFASLYALFSGVVFISIMGLLLSPIAHRVLHKFHLSDEDMSEKGAANELVKSPRL
ncbi:MAG TPA: hypothetical protein VNT99_01875 [Methylomirabilota bacterium]|nr:hypothetical protein [Methylomirabilota bacterium]